MTEDDVTAIDPETGESKDITPGAGTPDALLHDPDEGYDHEAEAETWVGDPAQVELRIDAIDGEEKRFVLVEPDDGTMDQLIEAVLDGDEHAFCAGVVNRPTLSHERWQSMTGRERKLLFDNAFSWLHFGEFVSIQRRI